MGLDMTKKNKASCLCGKVRFETIVKEKDIGVCYCGMCQKFGSSFLMWASSTEAVDFKGAEYIKEYESSDSAVRAFCTKCGTSLYYRSKNSDHYSFVTAIFEDQSKFELALQIFTDCKPDFYALSNKTESYTEAELKAKWGG